MTTVALLIHAQHRKLEKATVLTCA